MISLRRHAHRSARQAEPRRSLPLSPAPSLMPGSPDLDVSKDYCNAIVSLADGTFQVVVFNLGGIQATHNGFSQSDFEMFMHSGGWIIYHQRYDSARGGRVIHMSRRKEV
jgi:hypothetical protein